MDKQKKILALGGFAAVVLIGGWLVASAMATSRAEDKLYGLLDQYKLRDAVHWQALSASPFGSATLKGVTVRLGQGKNADQIAIDQIRLSDLENSTDRKSAQIEISGIADQAGFSPLGQAALMQAGGRAGLPPFSLKVGWSLNDRDDVGVLNLSFDQPKAFNGEFRLDLTRLRDLMRLTDRLTDSSPGEFTEMFGGFYGPLGVLEQVSKKIQRLEIRSVRVNVKDDGYAKRSRALVKRHDFVADPARGAAAKQRDEWFKKRVDAGRDQCKKDPGAAFDGAPLQREDCLALLDFLSGGSSKLSVKMEPARPVSLEQLFANMSYRDPYRFMRLLEMHLSS